MRHCTVWWFFARFCLPLFTVCEMPVVCGEEGNSQYLKQGPEGPCDLNWPVKVVIFCVA